MTENPPFIAVMRRARSSSKNAPSSGLNGQPGPVSPSCSPNQPPRSAGPHVDVRHKAGRGAPPLRGCSAANPASDQIVR